MNRSLQTSSQISSHRSSQKLSKALRGFTRLASSACSSEARAPSHGRNCERRHPVGRAGRQSEKARLARRGRARQQGGKSAAQCKTGLCVLRLHRGWRASILPPRETRTQARNAGTTRARLSLSSAAQPMRASLVRKRAREHASGHAAARTARRVALASHARVCACALKRAPQRARRRRERARTQDSASTDTMIATTIAG